MQLLLVMDQMKQRAGSESGGLTVSVLRFSVNGTLKALAQCCILGLVILQVEQLLSGARTS